MFDSLLIKPLSGSVTKKAPSLLAAPASVLAQNVACLPYFLGYNGKQRTVRARTELPYSLSSSLAINVFSFL